MKCKTSISLSEDVFLALNKRTRKSRKNRSCIIEDAIRIHLERLVREEQNARDLVIINRCADRLNKEALDALEYQAPL